MSFLLYMNPIVKIYAEGYHGEVRPQSSTKKVQTLNSKCLDLGRHYYDKLFKGNIFFLF